MKPARQDISAQGLRDREFAIPKPPDVWRVLILGDSVTYGFNVDISATFAKRLESLLDRKDGRTVPDRQALVALWVQAYVEGLRPTLKERRLQVRAEDKTRIWDRLRAVLAERGHLWALTGADAAERRTHFFRAEETEIYAPIQAFEERDVQKALIAQPAGRGGNLLVIEPPGPLAVPTAADETFPVAPDLLAYAELRYRGTGQALEAAELLLPKVLGDVTH